MVKFATSLFVAALVAAPAFASVNWDEFESRELSDQAIFGRDLTEAEASSYARELEDLVTRYPESEQPEAFARELENIENRSFKSFFKKIWHGIKKVGKVIGKVAGAVLRREDEGDFAREYDDEVDAREFDEELDVEAREIDDELVDREPNFFHTLGNVAKHAVHSHHVHSAAKHAVGAAVENYGREYEDDESELLAREFDEDDLIERDLELVEDLLDRDVEVDEELLERDSEEFDELD